MASPRFNFTKKGYVPSEVDEYISNLENVVKSYKEKDAAIKNAILNAQLAADNIIGNAKKEAEQVRRETADYFDKIVASVGVQKDVVASFEREYAQFFEKYLARVSADDVSRINARIGDLEAYLLKYSSDQFGQE